MRKQWFHGLIVITLLSLLLATFVPAPLAAASGSMVSHLEQDPNQGDSGQDNSDQNSDQNQNQRSQGQNQQGQAGQGQQQGNSQTDCFVGTDQASANFPTGCWTSVGAGERHWYQFRYQGLSADRNDDDDDDSSSSNSPAATVDVRLKMETPGCISFWVMTPERLQNPDPDGDGIEEPVGAGTPSFAIDRSSDDSSSDDSSSDDDSSDDDDSRQNNPDDNDDDKNRDESVLNWQGAANANITFYIIVRNNRDFSCPYSLSISGAGVPVAGQQAPQNQDPQSQSQPGAQNNNTSTTTGSNTSGSDDNGSSNDGNPDNSGNDSGSNDSGSSDSGSSDSGNTNNDAAQG